MTTLDFGPTTDALAALVRGVRDDQLDDPTPCPGRSVGDLLDHVAGLALAFTAAARKEAPPGGGNPTADVAALPDDWREEIPARLDALADCWRDPTAYSGNTQAGPIEMPADQAALVALDEVTVHALGPGGGHRPAVRRRPCRGGGVRELRGGVRRPARRRPVRSGGRGGAVRVVARPVDRRHRARPRLVALTTSRRDGLTFRRRVRADVRRDLRLDPGPEVE